MQLPLLSLLRSCARPTFHVEIFSSETNDVGFVVQVVTVRSIQGTRYRRLHGVVGSVAERGGSAVEASHQHTWRMVTGLAVWTPGMAHDDGSDSCRRMLSDSSNTH